MYIAPPPPQILKVAVDSQNFQTIPEVLLDVHITENKVLPAGFAVPIIVQLNMQREESF